MMVYLGFLWLALSIGCAIGAIWQALPRGTDPAPESETEWPVWIAIADGEGAEARPIYEEIPHQAIHDFMCACRKPWNECDTEGMREDVFKIDDPDEWTFDEDGAQFSMSWKHECGRVSLYRVRRSDDPK